MKKLSKKAKTKKVKKVKFEKLTPPQKRVAIARDVLEQIRMGRYISSTGAYVSGLLMKNGQERYHVSDKGIKGNFGKIKKCEVCAMGACLMSITKFENKLTFGNIGSSMEQLKNDKTKELFASIFSPEQLLLIERAFEGNLGGTTVGANIFGLREGDFFNQIEKCHDFYKKFNKSPKDSATSKEINDLRKLNEEKRLIAIMRNLIRNKGMFIP